MLCLTVLSCTTSTAQPPGSTSPTEALRENDPNTVILSGARIVTAPGAVIESGSILIRDGAILAVGEVDPVPGAKTIDLSGKTIYSGFIDAFHEVDVDEPPTGGVGHWNGNILPRRSAATIADSIDDVSALREQGITLRLIAPRGAIIKGTSCLVMLDAQTTLVHEHVAQHLNLTVPRDQRRDSYPNSPMGAFALLRQTLSDAHWYTEAWKAYQADGTLPRPERNEDLAALAQSIDGGRFIVDAANERMAIRAEAIAREFTIDIALRGSGREYRELERIARAGRMLLLPVNFPEAPDVSSEVEAADASLRDLMHWYFAPQNAGQLAEKDASFCLTTDGLESVSSYLENIRTAVENGLPEEAALAAMTTTPARWLGVDDQFGSVRPGTVANIVITDGDLFEESTKVVETWVAGTRYVHDSAVDPPDDPMIGHWDTTIRFGQTYFPITLTLKRDGTTWSGELAAASDSTEPEQSDSKEDGEETEDSNAASLKELARSVDRLTAWIDLADADPNLPQGPSFLTLITVGDKEPALFSTLTLPDGSRQSLRWGVSKAKPSEEDDAEGEDSDGDDSDDASEDEAVESASDQAETVEIAINYPLGGLGTTERIEAVPAVLFRGATVWTCSNQGTLKTADVLVIDGKIAAVGESLQAPKNCMVVDAKGKHLSPGLIDCHSHMATDGGVNESGQVSTAEVRIGDFIDNSDINIYRQLAGGLTMANVLHGSANPIGGQNQVIKLRWGDSMEALKMESAPGGIKFALGENVKRSRSQPQTRYPATRMGVEQLFQDRFLAAEEYIRVRERWQAGDRQGLPPRRDLELEAIAEILQQKRWIHCHSYRQDEIVALLDLLDKFKITIGTLQHILEGYKVADRMREHGAMASAFSDWWAYKFEVYDAIPDNGAIMHDAGIVVSFNSDDRELARHLNTEAAKAVKYGGVSPDEALKFVTLNPAKQLRIEDRVGSIEPGKDADLVLWSAPPLSTLARCEQTWVDGRLMFSLENDRKLRDRDAAWRAFLIAQILDGDRDGSTNRKQSVDEEDRWLRYDEFCHEEDHDLDIGKERFHFDHYHMGAQR
ncbi:MAG: amidohydrolase family protein [Planctomycetota bacterium]